MVGGRLMVIFLNRTEWAGGGSGGIWGLSGDVATIGSSMGGLRRRRPASILAAADGALRAPTQGAGTGEEWALIGNYD